jgi:hypothetical protein
MAIKYSPDSPQSGIPTLTEIVTDDEPQPAPPTPAPSKRVAPTPPPDEPADFQLPPKFDKTLEKLIYKKLHQQLLSLSQGLAAEVIAELQKHPPQSGKAAKKSVKNSD